MNVTGFSESLVRVYQKQKTVFSDSRDGIFGVVTRLQAGRFGFRIPTKVNYFSFIQTVHTGSGTHPTSNTMGSEVLSRSKVAGK
jgi:hypothetical protein